MATINHPKVGTLLQSGGPVRSRHVIVPDKVARFGSCPPSTFVPKKGYKSSTVVFTFNPSTDLETDLDVDPLEEVDPSYTPGGDPEVMKEVCDNLFPPGTDWRAFWDSDDHEDWYPRFVEAFREAGGYDPLEPDRDPEPEEQMEWLTRAIHYLRTRDDFIEFMEPGWEFTGLEEPLTDHDKIGLIGEEIYRPWNPSTNAVDLRAMQEKRRQKAKAKQKWEKMQETVAYEPFLDVLSKDMRFTEEEREAYEMTDEQAMSLISQGGKGADPYEVLENIVVRDPDEKIDYYEEGILMVEKIEDFIKRKGRWRESDADFYDGPELYGPDYDEYMSSVGPLPERKEEEEEEEEEEDEEDDEEDD